MKHLLTISALVLLAGCGSGAPDTTPGRDLKPEYVLEYAEGACTADADCQWAGEGCGGGHGMCTNTPEKYKDAVTTCDVNANFPSNRGYACGCVVREGRCGWER